MVDAIGTMIGFAPDIAAGVTTSVATGQQITEAAGLPWPAKLGLIIVLVTLTFGLYRSWQRLKTNDGSLTRPPYETDIEPEPDAVDMFDAPVEDLPAERPRRKRAPAKKPPAKPKTKAKPRRKSA